MLDAREVFASTRDRPRDRAAQVSGEKGKAVESALVKLKTLKAPKTLKLEP